MIIFVNFILENGYFYNFFKKVHRFSLIIQISTQNGNERMYAEMESKDKRNRRRP